MNALRVYRASVSFDDLFHDRQPKAGTFLLRIGRELVKDLRQHFQRDAGASVLTRAPTEKVARRKASEELHQTSKALRIGERYKESKQTLRAASMVTARGRLAIVILDALNLEVSPCRERQRLRNLDLRRRASWVLLLSRDSPCAP